METENQEEVVLKMEESFDSHQGRRGRTNGTHGLIFNILSITLMSPLNNPMNSCSD